MAKHSSQKSSAKKPPQKTAPQKTAQQQPRTIVEPAVPAAAPTKPAANKAKPPRPAKKQDVKDIERADSEGMGQAQGVPPEKKPAAATPGRPGGLKGGKAPAQSPATAKPKPTAKKPAPKR
jgi:hypothetical protein